MTQGAITRDALKQASGVVGNAYQEARSGIRQAPVTYTDDTSWAVGGDPAQLMVFDTDEATVYQIRAQHRNQEVRELVPSDYPGTLVTDRDPSYEAEELAGVDQQKCLSHLMPSDSSSGKLEGLRGYSRTGVALDRFADGTGGGESDRHALRSSNKYSSPTILWCRNSGPDFSDYATGLDPVRTSS
jgi:hypothetical protein